MSFCVIFADSPSTFCGDTVQTSAQLAPQLPPFLDKQLNYFKFTSIVVDEFPKVLRHAFKSKWDDTFGCLPGFQPWDDSDAVRKMFRAT